LLGFQTGAPKQVDVHEGTWKVFWVWSREKAINEEILSGTPSSKCFTHMCKRILGRMRETKVTDTELSWLHSALTARQPIDPTHLWSTDGVVKQHWVREILVRGITSLCWQSLWDQVLQGTQSISYPGLPNDLSIWS
jgi:hypothetical protein